MTPSLLKVPESYPSPAGGTPARCEHGSGERGWRGNGAAVQTLLSAAATPAFIRDRGGRYRGEVCFRRCRGNGAVRKSPPTPASAPVLAASRTGAERRG